MDWNLKSPSWDLSEVDEANLPNIEEEAAVDVGGSSRFGVYRIKGEFSVDLKLGQVGNSGAEQVVAKHKDAAAVGAASKMAPPPPPGSSKRARAVNNGSQRVSCLVDGCNADLSACRDYHRRHKVCEQHSKTAQVTIGGLKQRFCQQCSRFHSLEEFDEGKRSCRKRLDGHNRRRRKAQPESLTRSGGFLSNYQGSQLLPFSSSHVFPSSGVVNAGWSGGGVVPSCGDVRLHSHSHNNQQLHMVDHKQDLFLGSSPTSSCYKEGKQLAYLQTDPPHNNQNPHLPTASVCQTLLRSSSNNNNHSSPFSESTGGLRCKMFCGNINSLTSSVHDSSCALSLLSSPPPPPPHQTHNPMVPHHHHHHHPSSSSSSSLMQPLGLSLHDSSSIDPVLGGPHNGSDHCSSMYSMEDSHGSQGNEAPQLFPFQWE